MTNNIFVNYKFRRCDDDDNILHTCMTLQELNKNFIL